MSAVIHTSYPPNDPPPHPGVGWTRFVCISDTHSRRFKGIPLGDILLHAGDLSSWGQHNQLLTTVDWLKELPHELKVIIAGNHDHCLDPRWKASEGNSWRGLKPKEIESSIALMRNASTRAAGIVYLDHEEVELATSTGAKWKLYGTPAAPFYVQGAFQYFEPEEAEEEWKRIPNDVEILMTHTPAFGILDKTRRGEKAGCPKLAERIEALENCRLHVFGHIHEAHGACARDRKVGDPNYELVSVNAALQDADQAIIVDLRKVS